jgi:hypothetical protein
MVDAAAQEIAEAARGRLGTRLNVLPCAITQRLSRQLVHLTPHVPLPAKRHVRLDGLYSDSRATVNPTKTSSAW